MKTKIFKSLLILALSFFTVSSFAQTKDQRRLSPETRANKVTDLMKVKLKLDEAQTSKVHEILLKRFTENESDMEKMKAKRQEMIRQLSEVLTPEQMTEYKKLMEERKNKMDQQGKKGMHMGPSGNPPE